MSRVSGRLSYANVMSTIAVFLAIGGAAYAASRIGGNDMKRIVERPGGSIEVPPSNTDPAFARARCRPGELLIRGGYALDQQGRPDIDIRLVGRGVNNPRHANLVIASRPPGSPPARIQATAFCLRR